jgi:diguanylate cyclase (GGDEF)-like protein/putative nucleotidyltransferase with HDIG domain
MLQSKWKYAGLLCATASIAVLLLCASLYTLTQLPLLGPTGLALWAGLTALALVSSRFTVTVETAEGVAQSHKSVAETFIFLAAMIYATVPAAGVAPATILAGIVGLLSARSSRDPRLIVLNTSAAIISTYVAATLYGFLLTLFVGMQVSSGQGLQLQPGTILLPLCAFVAVQYFLSAAMSAAYAACADGKDKAKLSRESLIWMAITEVAGAASAALFYLAWQGGGFPFVFLGLLIIGMVYLMHHFNEQRVGEIRRAEQEKSRHIEEMASLHLNTIESLAIAIDAKDQTTHGHVRRTQIYATEMGKLLSVSQDEVHALRAGALLHDIGKLAVPEYILNKPGKLTEAEFAKMKIHPTVGGDILKRVNFPYPVEEIVRYHHEKWDGTGYPKGLRAEAIPLVARIISVVDFYDATRCDRPYRTGMKREESLALLRNMSGSSFDPKVVEIFIEHVEEFDSLIASQDIEEQVQSGEPVDQTTARPDAGLAPDVLGAPDGNSGFRSITEAQREVFAFHEIAQTIGSSLNLQDTVTLISTKLGAIVPFDTCIIFLVDDKSGKALPAHAVGEHASTFSQRRINIGDGVTGWVIANGRTMCSSSPELDLLGVPEEISRNIKHLLVTPLLREDGTFGAITLYSKNRHPYTTEHVRLLESVAQHASSALNNALTFEKTKESALIDPLTELPNARAFYMALEQRIAECQRLKNREPMTVISMDLDDFKQVNDAYGHATGDRLLASVAAIIKNQLRQMDILARYAGDEFTAILPMASGNMAVIIAERISSALKAHKFSVRTGQAVEVGVSIGIACYPADGETAEQLLTTADRNMRHDKHARKLAPSLAQDTSVTSIEAFR